MQTVEQKALALVNEVRTEYPLVSSEVASNLALCRAIEAHELDKSRHAAEMREQAERFGAVAANHVAETKRCCGDWWAAKTEALFAPYLTAPVDPLVEVMNAWLLSEHMDDERYSCFRAALEARGGRIVWDDAIVKKEAVNG